MNVGNIMYVYLTDLKNTLVMLQALKPDKFCKVISMTPVKGGSENEQYMKYELQSLYNDKKIYTVNNYLSPYQYCSLEDLEKTLEEVKELILPERLEDMIYLLKKTKESIKNDDKNI